MTDNMLPDNKPEASVSVLSDFIETDFYKWFHLTQTNKAPTLLNGWTVWFKPGAYQEFIDISVTMDKDEHIYSASLDIARSWLKMGNGHNPLAIDLVQSFIRDMVLRSETDEVKPVIGALQAVLRTNPGMIMITRTDDTPAVAPPPAVANLVETYLNTRTQSTLHLTHSTVFAINQPGGSFDLPGQGSRFTLIVSLPNDPHRDKHAALGNPAQHPLSAPNPTSQQQGSLLRRISQANGNPPSRINPPLPEAFPPLPEDEPVIFSYTSLALPLFHQTTIQWDNQSKRLIYTGEKRRGAQKQTKSFQPSAKQWRDLWKLLDTLRAWGWESAYINRGVMDGHRWHLSVGHGSNFVATGGSNDYPPGWQILQKLINQLVGSSLYEAWHDSPSDDLFRAAELSAQVHDGPQAAIPNLIQALEGNEWEAAAKALAKFDLEAMPAIPAVLRYADDPRMLYADFPVNEVLNAVANKAEHASKSRVRELGLPALPSLRDTLLERKFRTSARYQLLRIIKNIGLSDDEIAPILIACVQDGGHDGARLCKSVYYEMHKRHLYPPTMLPILFRYLQERIHEQFGFAEELVDIIRLFGQEALTQAVAILLPVMSDPSHDKRYIVAGGLEAAGALAAPAVPALIAALQDTTDRNRWRYAATLGKIGSAAEAIPALIQASEAGSSVQRHALNALGQIKQQPELVIPMLLTALTTTTGESNKAASNALRQYGEIGMRVLPALIDIVQTSPSEIRKGAIEIIEKLGSAANASIPTLVEVLEHDMDKWTRVAAAKALGAMGAEARIPTVLAALQQACEDSDLYVRYHIAKALGALDVEAALPSLIRVLQQSNIDVMVGVHMDALATLREWGARSAPAIPALLAVLKSKDSYVRRRAIDALGSIGAAAKDTLPILVTIMDDPEGVNTVAAAAACRKIDPQLTPHALELLIRSLGSPDSLERFGATQALEDMGAAAAPAIDALIAVSNTDEEIEMREMASKVVKTIQEAMAK